MEKKEIQPLNTSLYSGLSIEELETRLELAMAPACAAEKQQGADGSIPGLPLLAGGLSCYGYCEEYCGSYQ